MSLSGGIEALCERACLVSVVANKVLMLDELLKLWNVVGGRDAKKSRTRIP
jgi:hypothetical protein